MQRNCAVARRAVHALLLAGCCFALSGTVETPRLEAQGGGEAKLKDRSRREYLTPGLILETGARTAACDVLLFTKDGKHLLATGDDKVVRTWDVTDKGLVTSKEYPVLRWPI